MLILKIAWARLPVFYLESKVELIYVIPYASCGTRMRFTEVKTVVTYTPIDYKLGVQITLS